MNDSIQCSLCKQPAMADQADHVHLQDSPSNLAFHASCLGQHVYQQIKQGNQTAAFQAAELLQDAKCKTGPHTALYMRMGGLLANLMDSKTQTQAMAGLAQQALQSDFAMHSSNPYLKLATSHALGNQTPLANKPLNAKLHQRLVDHLFDLENSRLQSVVTVYDHPSREAGFPADKQLVAIQAVKSDPLNPSTWRTLASTLPSAGDVAGFHLVMGETLGGEKTPSVIGRAYCLQRANRLENGQRKPNDRASGTLRSQPQDRPSAVHRRINQAVVQAG
ncbi:MAG TPA: hypothetical protein VFV39_07650 [Limnobacter sp.]|nr:hypothetical protein [Limnobacter sp.]